jgi:hypothetical protein
VRDLEEGQGPECLKCGARETLDQWFLFMFRGASRCPLCGGFRLKKLGKVDDIDPMYKNPISYFQKWFGASIHWCTACRLQFYDVRAMRSPIALSSDEESRGTVNGQHSVTMRFKKQF